MDKDTLKQYYEKKARSLDEFHITYDSPSLYKRFFYTVRFSKVMSFVNAGEKEKILDIGCGSGFYTKALIQKGAVVTATDIAKGYLKQTKKLVGKNKRLRLCVADVTNLPFKDNIFDKVLLTEVIEHLPDYKVALREIKRVLKTDGILVISTPSKFSPMNLAYELKRRIKHYSFNEHLHEFTISEFRRTVNTYFQVERLEFANFFFPYPIDTFIIPLQSELFIKVLYILENLMQSTPLIKYLGWTMIIKAKNNKPKSRNSMKHIAIPTTKRYTSHAFLT